MITKELLKLEIDKIQEEHLELLYKIIKAFETSLTPGKTLERNLELDWHEFIESTYGCLTDVPIERPDQGKYEIREVIE